jgi:hypothetical protein
VLYSGAYVLTNMMRMIYKFKKKKLLQKISYNLKRYDIFLKIDTSEAGVWCVGVSDMYHVSRWDLFVSVRSLRELLPQISLPAICSRVVLPVLTLAF